MKFFTKFLLVLVFILQQNIFSQNTIPNSSFENWIDDNTPNDWIPNNFPGFWLTVSKSSTAHDGSFAARLQTVDFGGSPVPPFLQSMPFPVNQAYGSLMGYYQFQPVTSSEVLYFSAWFLENGSFVGFGGIDIGTAAASYMQFSFNIDYFDKSAVVPDTAYIWIGISDTGSTNQAGASALIDNLSFGPPVGVQEITSNIPENFDLKQNYPNPFNPSTKINFSIAEQSFVELIVYDLLGREIEKLVSSNYPAGEYSADFNAENLPNGIYIARMNAGKYSKAIKMTLLK